MRISDWSSDVCSSDLIKVGRRHAAKAHQLFIRPEAETRRIVFHQHRADRLCARIVRQTAIDDIGVGVTAARAPALCAVDDKLVVLDLRSEEHTSELQSLMRNSYAVFCLKKKNYRPHDT